MKKGNAVNKNRGRAVTVSGINISATTTAQNATRINDSLTFHAQKTMKASDAIVSAVSASAGDESGLVRKPIVFVTAVAPKLVPSDQASRWTLNQTPDSPAVRSSRPTAPTPAAPCSTTS